MSKRYEPQNIEKKWQKIWQDEKAFAATDDYTKPKYYALVEFPYPSGQGLHVGHPRPYTALDIVARKRRMQGYNVLYPMGWDAFGLPTENYAIKNHIHPKIVTKNNVHHFKVMSGVMEDDPLGAGEKDGTEIVTALMKELGFTDVAQLETVPYPQLAAAYAKVAPAIAKSGGYIGGGPKKGDYFCGNPFDAGFREHAHQIPMMIGTVYGEFATFAPAAYDKNKLTAEEILEILKKVYGDNAEKVLDAFKEAYPEKNGVDVLAIDRAMREPTVKLAKLFAKGGGKAYLYNFALEFPFQHGKPAWHCSDIPYFFGNADLVEICGIPDVSDKLESEIFGALLAFAKNGNPDHEGLPHWPEAEAEDADTMVFDRRTEVKHNYDDKVFAEINKVLKPWSFMDMMADNIQH